MAMAAMTTPRLRIHLFHVKRRNEWQVWELQESVPPSTARELAPERSPGDGRGPTSSQSPAASHVGLCLVMEVSADGQEVISWPGPETAPS